VPSILLDENLEGYKEYLERLLDAPAWREISSQLQVHLATFQEIGLSKSAPDDLIWELCQQKRLYLLTDNRNEEAANSLGITIRSRSHANSLPVFTISDLHRFRTERTYAELVIATLLEFLVDTENILGTGRLYLP
jgi:hypothetical protein